MGFKALIMIVFAVFVGLLAKKKQEVFARAPQTTNTLPAIYGQNFAKYCLAVSAYQELNRSFSGSVSTGALTALGFQFSTEFLTLVNNQVTPTGRNGRVITCYGTLPLGALSSALQATEYSHGFGTAKGTTWVNALNGVVTNLATSVPNDALVYVIQNGT